jgi:Ca2+/Na+ antiporter
MKKLTVKEIEGQISQCYGESSNYTAILSSICRQIAFAEGALFWFLYSEIKVSLKFVAVGFLVLLIYFLLDLVQYIIGQYIYRKKAKSWETDLKNQILSKNNYEFETDFFYWIDRVLFFKLSFLFLASLILIVGYIIGLFLC